MKTAKTLVCLAMLAVLAGCYAAPRVDPHRYLREGVEGIALRMDSVGLLLARHEITCEEAVSLFDMQFGSLRVILSATDYYEMEARR
jgi:hypothetical protein